ncbi:hypothetical protein [Lysinibacillus boronitolerans]|uniref:hypothetical protein n=1 Tax=Lysinibacillus boronitolerans TaxID=309788 RepID=UPI00289A72BD|nr:hypothetical protein [Bacillus mobilis]
MEDKRLIETFNTLEELREKPDLLIVFHSRLKAIIDEEAQLADAKNKSFEEGFKDDTEEARKTIAKGYDNEKIMDMTDLTVEQIKSLRNE